MSERGGIMKIRNLTKKMDDNLVLKDVSFDLKAGEITALIGRNGVGKTTLFSTMTGIYLPDEGDVFLDEESIFKHPEVKQQLFFLEDNMNHFNTYSVQTVVKIYRQIYTTFDEAFFNELMQQFELPMKAKLMSFSKGRKALFFIILAFSLNVRFLLLDEPMDGLDIIMKKADFSNDKGHGEKTRNKCSDCISSFGRTRGNCGSSDCSKGCERGTRLLFRRYADRCSENTSCI